METSFQHELTIASYKMVPNDPGNLLLSGLCFDLLTVATGNQPRSTLSRLAVIAEEVALHNFESSQKSLESLAIFEDQIQDLTESCTFLSKQLATCGLFRFTNSVMEAAPYLLSSAQGLFLSLKTTAFLFDTGDRGMHVDLLRRLLQGGVDINEKVKLWWEKENSTVWSGFLKLLRQRSNVPAKHWVDWKHMSAKKRLRALDGFDDEIGRDWYSDPYMQDAIKLFVEFGAELEPQDIDTLMTCLPKPGINDFDWPEFLRAYSQPEKRAQLEEDRRNRIRRWPEIYWSERDKELLRIPPDLSEDWWSVRGRRLLDLN